MGNGFSISRLATQTNKDDEMQYNFRSIEAVYGFVTALSKRHNGVKPIYINHFGQPENTIESFVDSIDYLGKLYGKKTGVLLRGAVVNVDKICLGDAHLQNIKAIISEYVNLNQIPQVRDSLSSKLRCCIGGVFLLS